MKSIEHSFTIHHSEFGTLRFPMDCLFCKIIAGQIPGALVYQDERLVAFKDINPQAPMHVLVVPRRHIASLNELNAGDDGLVGEMVRRAAALAAEHGHAERGYR